MEKAVRRTLNLSRMTRSKLNPLLAGNWSFQEQHERRCGALYASMMKNDNRGARSILDLYIYWTTAMSLLCHDVSTSVAYWGLHGSTTCRLAK